jgi:hypothetical protein
MILGLEISMFISPRRTVETISLGTMRRSIPSQTTGQGAPVEILCFSKLIMTGQCLLTTLVRIP